MANPDRDAVSAHMARLGRKGGQSTDPLKAKARAKKGGLARAQKNNLGRFKKAPKL